MSVIIHGDCSVELKTLADNSIDFVCTDPPYGYSFMGKNWDKAVPSVEIWQECLRVLKPGAFCCVMSAPRSDVQCAMISRLQEAGFRLDFTPIYWTYASGFPKAGNIGKLVDKRGGVSVSWFGEWLKNWRKENNITQKEIAKLFPSKTGGLTGCAANWELGLNIPTPKQFTKICRTFDLPFDSIEAAEREVTGKGVSGKTAIWAEGGMGDFDITTPATDQAKALDGSYAGYQPKPAVEVIIVAMKPLREKTFVDQALKNGKGISWLDDGRIPTNGETPSGSGKLKAFRNTEGRMDEQNWHATSTDSRGRFPANLLVSDDVLNDGVERKSGWSDTDRAKKNDGTWNGNSGYNPLSTGKHHNDSGSYSRYFDLDAWWAKTLPFLLVPKAAKSEKNKGLRQFTPIKTNDGRAKEIDNAFQRGSTLRNNHHPTVKPLKLMSYLITVFTRPSDVVLDPFVGSGTLCVAAELLERESIGIEREAGYVEIARARLENNVYQRSLDLFDDVIKEAA